jgi:hypothetical protein
MRQACGIVITCLAIIIGLSAKEVSAQQGTASLRGRVVDEQGAVLPGVSVVITHQETGVFRDTQTGADGSYSVANLVAGTYRVTAELEGFSKLTREDLLLVAGATQTLELQLRVGSLTENLTVTGASPQVDLTSAQIGGNVSLEEVQAIPSVSHTVVGYLQVVPGVIFTPGATKPSLDAVTINGSAGGIQHFLDGGANFSGVFAASWTRVQVPSEVIQEVVTVTSQMPAEYGDRTGAIINTITKQGTNAFHGSAYASYINDRLTAANYFQKRDNLDKPEASRHVSGVTLGGPIVRDRVFFFGLLERTFQGKANAVTYPSNPDKSFTTQAVAEGTNMFVRIDHQINRGNMYAVRFLGRNAKCTGDPGCRAGGVGTSIATSGATLQSLTDEWEWDTLVVANYNKVLGDTRLNVLTFSAPRQTIQTGVPSDEPSALTTCVPCLLPTLRYLSFDDQAPYFHHQRWEPVYRIENAFTWFLPGSRAGSHDLKFGAVYSHSTHRQENPDAENGIFSFPSNRPFNAADPSTYPERLTIRNGSQASSTFGHFAGFYGQDKWQVGNHLTLNLGVRYEVVDMETPNAFNPLFTDRESYPIDWNNIQPRFGVAYAHAGGRGVIRGGYGQFFQSPTFSDSIDTFWRQGVYGTGLVVNFPSSGVPDPGPAAGRLPTDPFLVNGPVVNRSLLDQVFPRGTLIRSTSTVFLDNPDRELPSTRQATVGYEREIWTNVSFGADYVHIWGDTNLIQHDLNPGLRATTGRTAPITRTDLLGLAGALGISPFSTSVVTFRNTGREKYDGLNLSLEKRFSRSWGGRVSYTLARAYNDSAQANYQVLGVSHPELAWGPSGRTQVLSLSGRVELPWVRGLGVSSTFRTMTGMPFTLINSNVDGDRNGILADTIPAGTYRGNGADALTVDNAGGQGGAIGPAFGQLDMRVSYRVSLAAGRTLEVGADAFNLTNEPNFSNPSGDQRQPTFLVPTALVSGGVPRQMQVGIRFGF